VPPDLLLSIKHGKAKRIARIEEKVHNYEEVCECCGFPLVTIILIYKSKRKINSLAYANPKTNFIFSVLECLCFLSL